MKKVLRTIEYRDEGMGIIPLLHEHVSHAFSWGKNSPNMSHNFGEQGVVAEAVQLFLNKIAPEKDRRYVVVVPAHTNSIVEVHAGDTLAGNIDCDCLVTESKNIILAVKPADCPVVIITTERDHAKRFVAVAHAGRKDIENNLIARAADFICQRFSIKAEELLVGVAPCITAKNYFVLNFSDLNNPDMWRDFIEQREGKYYLDMVGIVRSQILNAGILDENIMQYDVDTYDSAEEGNSFSHRHSLINPEKRKGRFIVAAALD